MSKKKTTNDKITDVDEQMRQLAEEKKALQKKKREEELEEQKQRCNRRGVKIEKQLPDLATMTDEQFNIFAEKVLFTEQTKTIISDILTPQPTPSRCVKSPPKSDSEIDTAQQDTQGDKL
jgi:hypothetical protein